MEVILHDRTINVRSGDLVRIALSENNVVEWLWVSVSHISKNGTLWGYIDDDPKTLKQHRIGTLLNFRKTVVEGYIDGKEMKKKAMIRKDVKRNETNIGKNNGTQRSEGK